MKSLLIALNSRNLHTNLAVRYLYASCREKHQDVSIYEGNINIRTEELISQIFCEEVSTYCFSTYIWNITEILKIAASIKKLKRNAIIIFGGPEASFRAEELLSSGVVDYVVRGDGELALPALLLRLETQFTTNANELNKLENEPTLHQVHADSLPFPYAYEESLMPSKDQLLYYETSRGCPFSCSYCLSSSMYSVTYRSLEKVFMELKFFIDQQVPLVKFVDRTWNGNRERAKEILQFILANPSNTKFHFEVAGDLFDKELLDLMRALPYDAIQLEIGVQSSNEASLEAACRKTDLKKLRSNVTEIISWGNIHVHLDLIAGLPYEDFESFGHSFDYVFAMKSQMLQLGFLKLLHGSSLKLQAEKYGILSNDFPPYEILKNEFITYKELLQLKDLEEVLEQYYNSGRNRIVIDFLIQFWDIRPFDFFMIFSKYLRQKEFFFRKQSPKDSFIYLYEFFKNESTKKELYSDSINSTVIDLMKYDWIISGINSPAPDFMKTGENPFIKKYLLSCAEIPKESNWILASKDTTDYLKQATKVLDSFDPITARLKKTDSLLFVFNSTKGKKVDAKLLNVVIFDPEAVQ